MRTVPTATYRLQLRREFTFADATAVLPYLARLGISHVYCSPILQAVPGSAHGYDVIDHSRISDDLGGDEGWVAFVAACHGQGLGIVVDIVPNHMAIPDPPTLNKQYADVLEHGRASPFAHWFDIDWDESERVGRLVYRRFFDVDSLIGVRVEEPDVFEATHARILAAVHAGEIDGLRIDHPDGLADPAAYLERLSTATGGIWTVVEKILEPGEELPSTWRCDGTTGYDAILTITQVMLDPSGERPLTDIYRDLGGGSESYETVVDESKRYVVENVLVPEVDRLEREQGDRAATVERLVGTQVYRTYTGDPGNVRFEQTTGPVMAKGVEDTAFYRYLRLTALNEVGGDPGSFGLSVEQWHRECERRARDWPHAMTTLTTHDTKRSEDVRARLLVLAEIPDEWASAVTAWRAAARRHGELDRPTDYLFWQTLVGAWPLTVERMTSYLEKATREAKTNTSWIAPNQEYDANVRHFTEAVFADDALMHAVGDWCAQHIDEPGLSNALAQKLLQLTMPGVPDVYQGQEVTAPALVDPDNRRAVDFGYRATILASDLSDSVVAQYPKWKVTAETLRLRRERPASFAGAYAPLSVDGSGVEHAIAYLRGDDVAVVVSRLPVGLSRRGGFGETAITLPPGVWRDVFGETRHEGTKPLGEITATLPVALLRRETG